MQDDKEKQKRSSTAEPEYQEVDYTTLDIGNNYQEVDYSTLPIPDEPEKKKEESIAGPSELVREPLQLISPGEIEKKTPQFGEPGAFTQSELDKRNAVVSNIALDNAVLEEITKEKNYINDEQSLIELANQLKVPYDSVKQTADLINQLPIKGLKTSYIGGFGRAFWDSLAESFDAIEGARKFVEKASSFSLLHSLFPDKPYEEIETGEVPHFSEQFANKLRKEKEVFPEAPSNVLGEAINMIGYIVPDILISYAAPALKLPEAMGGFKLSKFATLLATKKGFGTYEKTDNVGKMIKDAGLGFYQGELYNALGLGGKEFGNWVSRLAINEPLGALGNAIGTSTLFMGENTLNQWARTGKVDWSQSLATGLMGLSTFSPKNIIEPIIRSAETKAYGSYFSSSERLEKEAMDIKTPVPELRRQAIKLRQEAFESNIDQERNQKFMAAQKIENIIGIKFTSNQIVKNPENFIQVIQEDELLPQNQKDNITKKIAGTYMNNHPKIKKVKPEIDEINKLVTVISKIDESDKSDTEKEILKKESEDKIAELQSIIDSKLKIGEQPPAPAEEEMKKVEPIAGKVEEVKPRERFTETKEAEFEHTFDLRDQKTMLNDRMEKLNKVLEDQKGKEFKPTEIEEGLPGKKKTTKLGSIDEINNLIDQSKERLDIIDNELKRREGEEILEEGPMKIGRKAYTDKETFLSDLRKMRDFENIPGGIDVPSDMYKEVNEILAPRRYEVGITTATKGLGEIGKQLDEAQKLFNKGKFDKANKIYTGILDQGHKKLSELFKDVPDIEIRLAQTKGTFFRETEPTFDYEIIDKGDNLDIIKERLVNLGEEWKQKNVHVSIRENTLPEGANIGEELEDGSVHEINYDINFGEQLSDQQYKDLLNKINDLGLAGATLKNDKKTLNLYNISKLENNEQYEAKLRQLNEYLRENRLGEKIKQGFRRLWVYGRTDGGATRSYEEIRSEIRGRKAKPEKIEEEPKYAISTGKKTKGLGEEKGSEAGIGEMGKNGIRNAPENQQLETGAEPQKEISTEKPIIVKEGINLFGFPVDDYSLFKFWKKYMTAKGFIPKSVFDEYISIQGRVKTELYKANYLVADLRRAMREVYGKTILGTPKISKEERERLNGVLQDMGEGKRYEALQDVAEPLHEPLLAIRDHVDALSRELIRSGVTEGEVKAVIQENLGYYLTRTYRAHNDKEWKWENISDDIKNRAISWMRIEFPDYTDAQINTLLKAWLYQKDGLFGYIQKGKLGSKDLGILMKRKGIPVELRDLLGEYKDPMYNYSTSVLKMVNLIEKQKFLEFVRKDGLGKYLFTFDTLPDSEHFVIIAAKESRVMEPLNGLYTTPEIARAFETFGKSDPISGITRFYLKYINVPVKYGKTILSPVTHARNYFANYWFHIANGRYFFIKEIPAAHATMWNDLTKKDSKEFRDYMQKLVKYNVIGESTRAGETHDAITDVTRYTEEFDKYGDSLFKKVGKATLRGAEKLYQIEDDVHKIIAFEYERKRYESVIKKKNPGKSEEEINDLLDQKAAELVRKTMATYSLVPKLIKSLRRFPLVGTFVSFPAEVIRTYANTLQLAIDEMKDADTRDIGIARLSGLMVASTATAVIATGTRYLTHVDKQDLKDMRRFVMPYSQNSDLVILRDEGNGKYLYLDEGFSDPYNYIKKPVNAFLRGEDWQDSALQSMKEMATPFLGEELVASKLIDVSRNVKKGTKDPIYNPELPYGDQLQQIWNYLWKQYQPGVVSQGVRIARSFSEKADEYGLSPGNEIMNLFLGLRSTRLDANKAFGFKIRSGGTRLDNARNIYMSKLYNKLASDKEKSDSFEKANKAVEKVIMDLNEDYRAAIRLGVDKKELFTKLDNMNIDGKPAGRKVRTYIIKGKFRGLDERTGKIK